MYGIDEFKVKKEDSVSTKK